MNIKQRILCVFVIMVVIGMAAYPPFNLHGREGVVISLGHRWFLSPPEMGTIDSALLIAQWVGTLIVGGISFFLLKDHI